MRSFCSGVVRANTISWYVQRTSSCSGVRFSRSAPVTTMLCGGSTESSCTDIWAFSLSLNELWSCRSATWCTAAGFEMIPACVAMATAVAGWSPVTTKKRIPAPRHVLAQTGQRGHGASRMTYGVPNGIPDIGLQRVNHTHHTDDDQLRVHAIDDFVEFF